MFSFEEIIVPFAPFCGYFGLQPGGFLWKKHGKGVALAVLPMLLLSGLEGTESRRTVTITIDADGKCRIYCESVEGRTEVVERMKQLKENQAAAMEAEEDGAGEDALLKAGGPQAQGSTPESSAAAEDAKKAALSDEELIQAFKIQFEEQKPRSKGKYTLEKIDPDKDQVLIVYSVDFTNLLEMVASDPAPLDEFGFDRLVLEKEGEGSLKITLSSYQQGRNFRNQLYQMQAARFQGEFRFVLPGKILSSSLPSIDNNTTWLTIDTRRRESLRKLKELLRSSAVITAEMGGLALETSLDSDRRDAEENFQGKSETWDSDVPIIEGGYGFVAEPTGVTTTTTYYFPGGKEQIEEQNIDRDINPEGIAIGVNFFGPKDRNFISVKQIRVVSAIDDRKRVVPPAESALSMAPEENPALTRKDCVPIQLFLGLPEPDAEALAEVKAEAVVTTFSQWKEHRISGIEEQNGKEIDLSEILAGAKLVIQEVKNPGKKPNQRVGKLSFDIRGPAAIRQFALKIEMPGLEYFQSYLTGDKITETGGQTTRSVTFTLYYFQDDDGKMLQGKPEILVRYPVDVRRERVEFTLQDLDLF